MKIAKLRFYMVILHKQPLYVQECKEKALPLHKFQGFGQMVHDYIRQNQSMMRIIETSIRENWNYLAYDDFGTDVQFTYGEAAICSSARGV